MIMLIVLFVIILTGIILWPLIIDGDLDDFNPVVYWRKSSTPSCRGCKHNDKDVGRYKNSYYCLCPDAIEAFERIDGTVYDSIKAEKVRGRKYCKFESTVIEDNKEEKE